MSNDPAKPVLEYQRSGRDDWATLQWFASHDEASDDMVLLTEAGIPHELVEQNDSLRRPNGSVVRLQLRVPPDLEDRGARVLDLVPSDLSNASIAITDAGDHVIEMIKDGAVVDSWVPLVRFDTAMEFARIATMLENAGLSVLWPRLAPATSPGAAPLTPGRFVLFVHEQHAEAARAAYFADAASDPDEPRCPRCRSWRTSEFEDFLEGVRRSWRGEKIPPPRCICGNCGHIGTRESFLTPCPPG